VNRASSGPSNGNVVLKPYFFGAGTTIDITGANVPVSVKTPTTQKYKDNSKFTVSLSKYLNATYNPNNAALPMNGNRYASCADKVSFSACGAPPCASVFSNRKLR
jgi:hypothetical protein